MKRIKLSRNNVEIRTNVDEVTIGSLLKCNEILTREGDELDNYIYIIEELSNLSLMEIEDLPFKELSTLLSEMDLSDFDLDKINIDDIEFKNQIILDNHIYKSSSESSDDIRISVKEVFAIRRIYTENGEITLCEIAAVLFRELDNDGNLTRDLSEEAINKRCETHTEMTLNVILPYINDIKNHIQ